MKMTKLATLFLTATLSLASGAALAADSGAQTNNGQANAAADAGQARVHHSARLEMRYPRN